jgi:hypothetical protein
MGPATEGTEDGEKIYKRRNGVTEANGEEESRWHRKAVGGRPKAEPCGTTERQTRARWMMRVLVSAACRSTPPRSRGAEPVVSPLGLRYSVPPFVIVIPIAA